MQETIRAKFQCHCVEHLAHEGRTAKFSAIYGDKGENKDFTEATPYGTIEIGISGDVVAKDFFEPGKEYYIDFTQAEE